MAGRPVRISIIANGRQARAELQRTALASEQVGKAVSRAGKLVAGAFAVSGIIRAGRAILANGDAYTSQLNKIEALTTAQQQAQVGGLRGVAKQLEASKGAYAKYGNTVADAASGVTELVKAGQSLPQALKSVNATLVLAKAGELDVADASSLVAVALKTWRLPARRAADVANYLANAANISTANVADLGEALKFVAPVAAKVGVSAAQTTAYLAQLSNAGINGTLAGTGLRKVLESLQAPTGKARDILKDLGVSAFDSQGKVRPFSDVLTQLRGKLDSLTDQKRKGALRAIFGLTGITSAQVLLDNVDSLDKYVDGVKRAGAAQKLAEANSKGLVGTLRRAQALFKSTGQQAFRAFSPLVDDALRPAVEWLERNQGALEAQGRTLGGRVLPYLKTFRTTLANSATSVRQMGRDLRPFVPLLQGTARTVKTAADGFNDLPGPIKTLALEAGVAALVLPKIGAGVAAATAPITGAIVRVKALRAELALMRTDAAWQQGLNRLSAAGVITTTNLNNTTRATANLNKAMAAATPAIKGAAGVGGMLGLVQSTKIADSGLRTLSTTASGALLGFSVGGPWGAAIGAGAGLLGSLWQATHKASAEMARVRESKEQAKQALQDLRGTLDETSGAFTKLTRTMVTQKLQQAGAFDQLSGSGLTRKQIVDAALGQQGALGKLTPTLLALNAQLDANKAKMEALRPSYEAAAATDQKRAKAISDQIVALDQQNQAIGKAVSAFGQQRGAAANATASVKAQALATQGYVGTLRGLPKQLVTQVKTTGLDGSIQQVKTLAAQYNLTPKQIVTLMKAEGIQPTKAALQSVIDKMQSVKSQSSALGSAAGSNFGAGYVAGIRPWTGRAASAAAAMAASAQAAAKHADMSRSPSRKMMKIGGYFGQGYAVGIAQQTGRAITAATTLAQQSQAAVEAVSRKSSKGRHSIAARISQLFAPSVRGDAQKTLDSTDKLFDRLSKKQLPAVKKIVREYARGKQGLNALAKAQDKVAQSLDDAENKLADAKQAWQDYHDSVRDAVVSFGDITQLGKNAAGNASADAIISQLTARANAAEQYAAVVKQLKAAGLNDTALQQIIDAGVDGGLQTAQAIIAGGPKVIQSINDLQKRITTAGDGLGASMANHFKLAGVQAAQGLVDGLESQAAVLRAASVKLANAMVKAIKRRLGIKSPSTVFKQIGRQNIEGLRIGMNGTYVKRTGELTAASLVKGFGSPDLDAFMRSPSMNTSAGQQGVRVTLSAAERDALLAGRDVILNISAAEASGARALS